MTQSKDLPLITVLVPVYNCEEYIGDCLESIVNQEYKNIQLVIYNDGSTDGSLKVCQRYGSRYPFITIIGDNNKGVATARNKLLEYIKGDFFLFVDADDWIEPDTISFLYDTQKKNDSDITVCAVKREPLSLCEIAVESWDKERFIVEFLKHKRLNGSLWNKLIRSSLIGESRFRTDVFYGEDALFLWHLLMKADRVVVTNKPLYNYRYNAQSISRQQWSPERKGTGHYVWESICKDVEANYPEYADIAYARFALEDMWGIYFASLSGYRYDNHIKIRQNNIRNHINGLRKWKLDGASKYYTAFLLSRFYGAGILFRLINNIRH